MSGLSDKEIRGESLPLQVSGLTKSFGGLMAVCDVDLEVAEGEIMGLIGPNGAGKSTLLNLIDGTLAPTSGRVVFNGEDVTRLPAHQRARRRMARVHQANILFHQMTVLENILVGLHLQTRFSLAGVLFNRRAMATREARLKDRALVLLELVGLADFTAEKALNLPHGRQRLLGLAVALAVDPELILLDEPFTGLNAAEVESMMAMIQDLRRDKGLTCIIIEHNLRAVMDLCDRIAVLNFGRKIAQGPPGQIMADPAVTEAYLGSDDDVA